MESKALFERDLLYPTETLFEFGSIHVSIFSPSENARIPVVIENKTVHSLLKYINTIVRIMQSDIFDRIFIDIKKNVDLYIAEDKEVSALYDKKYVQILFNGDSFDYRGIDSI
jgi:hypothetical protein